MGHGQGRLAASVPVVRIRPVLQEDLDDAEEAPFGGEVQRRVALVIRQAARGGEIDFLDGFAVVFVSMLSRWDDTQNRWHFTRNDWLTSASCFKWSNPRAIVI